MLETKVKVGVPSFFEYVPMQARGAGGLCSVGVVTSTVGGDHKFLPFVPNGINWCATQGQDVISAHFTGCLMAYFVDNGVAKVAHISTGADFGDCKGAWDLLKRNYTNVIEFKPSDFTRGVANERCYGLITNDQRLYTILTWSDRVEIKPGHNSLADHKFVAINIAG